MTFPEPQVGALQCTDNGAVILAEVPALYLTKPTLISVGTQGAQASNAATITGTGDTHSFIIRLRVTAPNETRQLESGAKA